MAEVHRQTCQECGCRDMRNYILRQPGKRQAVLVRCLGCDQLVARYELSSYYHHKKGFEAWLRSTAVATESALDLRETFEAVKSEAQAELELCLSELQRQGKER
jgi:hypothetical protein